MPSDLIATEARKPRANNFKNDRDICLYTRMCVINIHCAVGSQISKQGKIEIRAYEYI